MAFAWPFRSARPAVPVLQGPRDGEITPHEQGRLDSQEIWDPNPVFKANCFGWFPDRFESTSSNPTTGKSFKL
jgi:hypothetical protein